MSPPSPPIPGSPSPPMPAPAAATAGATETEDRLLAALIPLLQAERERLPRLEHRIRRLRRLLVHSHDALRRCRAELSQAREAAGRDALTGLANRHGFEPPLRRELARHAGGSEMLALLFVDLDGFKAVNDRLGHDAGDDLLRIVGARLAAGMRRSDLVCRHGGDEFVCVLPNLSSTTRAGVLAAALLATITEPCRLGNHVVRIQASIGVAIYPRDGDTVPTLLRSADTAMYAAKACHGGVAMARPRQPAGGH